MQENRILEIIRICRRIDEGAEKIYATLARSADSDVMTNFWTTMSKEEAEHVEFWKRAEDVAKMEGLPEIFDRPDTVQSELEAAWKKTRELIKRSQGEFSTPDSFIIAYRMEFYLLHPAFEMLFHLLGPTGESDNPEDDYEDHIASFIDMFHSQGAVTPELELLGEALQRMWRENRSLAAQASNDDLTSLLNRRVFFTIAVQFAYLAQRTGAAMGVLMIDVDHFKSVNDDLGHLVGDKVLRSLAATLKGKLRRSDVIGRYGGEEFVVLLPAVKDGNTAHVAETLRSAVEGSKQGGVDVTISIGYAEAKVEGEASEALNSLVHKADTALYLAKKEGRNCAVGYDAETEIP